MPIERCDICEAAEPRFLMTDMSNGDTTAMCLPCFVDTARELVNQFGVATEAEVDTPAEEAAIAAGVARSPFPEAGTEDTEEVQEDEAAGHQKRSKSGHVRARASKAASLPGSLDAVPLPEQSESGPSEREDGAPESN